MGSRQVWHAMQAAEASRVLVASFVRMYHTLVAVLLACM
jgi:hypothetical protein